MGEESRLDEAIERADQLLVMSLKQEEHRRSRRRVVFISLGIAVLGGLFMSAILCFVLLVPSSRSPTVATNVRSNSSEAATQDTKTRGNQRPVESTALALNDPDAAGRLSAEGWGLWQKQAFDAAAAKFDEAVKLDPQNVSAWNGLGWASFNGGNYGPAEKAFRKVLALEPKHPAALNGLGQLALVQRKYGRAEEFLLKAAPQAPAAWYGLAKVYLLTGKYDKAAKWTRKIIGSGEADPDVAKWLEAAMKKDLPGELRRSIEPDPNATQVARAWQLMNQGRHAEAKAQFAAVLAKFPKDPAALNGMGWCLLGSGKPDEAKPYFERALATDPKAGGSMNGLARVFIAKGDTNGAIKIWQKMVETIPGPHAGTAGLANAYFEKRDYRKALPFLEQLAKAYPNDEDVQHKLAQVRAGQPK